MTFKLSTLSTNPVAHGLARLLPSFTVSLSTGKEIQIEQSRKKQSFQYYGKLDPEKEKSEFFNLMHLMQRV